MEAQNWGLPRMTADFACDTSNINHNRRLFICHHSCLLESHFGLGFGEEFHDKLLSFFLSQFKDFRLAVLQPCYLAKQTEHNFKVSLLPIFMLYFIFINYIYIYADHAFSCTHDSLPTQRFTSQSFRDFSPIFPIQELLFHNHK